jgi:hypothetical protein
VSFVCVVDFLSWWWSSLCNICLAFFYAFLHLHYICNMMYRHLCILGCMHFVSYRLFRKSFSYIHGSPWCAIYDHVS